MDEILKGLLLSNHPSKLKLDALDKIAKVSSSKHFPNEKVCNNIYETCLLYLKTPVSNDSLKADNVINQNDVMYAAVENVLNQWIINNRNYYEEYLNTAFLNINLKNVNLMEYLNALHCYLRHYKNCFDLFSLHYKIQLTETLAAIILRKSEFNFLVIVCQFCIKYPIFLTMQGDKLFKYKFVKHIVDIICKHPFKWVTSKPETEKTLKSEDTNYTPDEQDKENKNKENKIPDLYKDLTTIYIIFSQIVSSDMLLMKYIGNLIFKLISNPSENPSINIARLLPCLQLDLVTQFLEEMMSSTGNDKVLSTALLNLVDFSCYPDESLCINEWIVQFMKCLLKYQKYKILFEVIEKKIQQVCNLMLFKSTRKSSVSILTFMLITYLHSPHLFHQVIPSLSSIVTLLNKDDDLETKPIVQVLVELCYTMMFHFPGYPDLYTSLLDSIQGYERPSEDKMKVWLKARSTLPKYIKSTINVTAAEKSDTGKIGLENLGNTCYANSVIQALFNSKSFRDAILTTHLNIGLQQVTSALQKLFALLFRSQRPFLSPDEFISLSRPQWFQKGSQQDCSEYLKYLFDILEKEEKQTLHDSIFTQYFTGSMRASIECHVCKNISCREEVFNDIPLSFDENPIKNCTLKGGDSSEQIQRKMSLTVDPSSSKEMPDISEVTPAETNQEQYATMNEKTRTIIELLNDYFLPENLTDQNQYFCEKCQRLVDAVKSNELIKPPKYLILTLKRFTFDCLTQQRNKILQVLDYPIDFFACNSCNPITTESCGKTFVQPNRCYCNGGIHYRISSVVVHSGISSESGHYYCYVAEMNSNNEICWYLMNDSRVSRAQTECLGKLGASFPRDSPYICIYEKVELNPVINMEIGEEVGASNTIQTYEVKLSEELLELIARDNEKYFQENKVQPVQSKAFTFNEKFPPDEDDFSGGGSGGGGFNCGTGNNFSGGGRVVF